MMSVSSLQGIICRTGNQHKYSSNNRSLFDFVTGQPGEFSVVLSLSKGCRHVLRSGCRPPCSCGYGFVELVGTAVAFALQTVVRDATEHAQNPYGYKRRHTPVTIGKRRLDHTTKRLFFHRAKSLTVPAPGNPRCSRKIGKGIRSGSGSIYGPSHGGRPPFPDPLVPAIAILCDCYQTRKFDGGLHDLEHRGRAFKYESR